MLKDNCETIAAISTPMGEGGIGIVRMSGSKSLDIAQKIFRPKGKRPFCDLKNRTLYLGNIIDSKGEIIDEVLLAIFKAPYTYTREDMVEINCHGGLASQKRILSCILDMGARLAEPGEFTKRAFLNGRIDLSQAEAVIDIIRAKTDRALAAANRKLKGDFSKKIEQVRSRLLDVMAHIEANIDFPEEDIPEADPVYIKGEITETLNITEELIPPSSAIFLILSISVSHPPPTILKTTLRCGLLR